MKTRGSGRNFYSQLYKVFRSMDCQLADKCEPGTDPYLELLFTRIATWKSSAKFLVFSKFLTHMFMLVIFFFPVEIFYSVFSSAQAPQRISSGPP